MVRNNVFTRWQVFILFPPSLQVGDPQKEARFNESERALALRYAFECGTNKRAAAGCGQGRKRFVL